MEPDDHATWVDSAPPSVTHVSLTSADTPLILVVSVLESSEEHVGFDKKGLIVIASPYVVRTKGRPLLGNRREWSVWSTEHAPHGTAQAISSW